MIFSMNITKKSFIVKYVFFDIARDFANKIIKNVNDEVNNICDDILNTTKNINFTSKINEINEVEKINKAIALNFFA